MSRFEIVRVDARTLDLALVEPFAIATGAQQVANNVLVTVELACGAVGFGEAAPFPAVSGETQERSLAAARSLAAVITGRDASQWRSIAATMTEAEHDEPAARSGIEQAILDAFARALGAPLASLYGGLGAPLSTDVTITAGDVEHARKSARAFYDRGFGTLKVKVGAADPERDAARVAAVHAEVPTARLLLDANGGYDEPAALELLRVLDRLAVPIALFEQPIPPGDATALARIRAQTSVPLCADESARSAADVIDLVRQDAVQSVNVKIMKTGIVEALSIIEVARAANLDLMIGGMVESEIAMLHSAHLAVGTGGARYVDLDTPLFLRDRSTVEGYPIDGDRIRLDPSAEGIGVRPLARFSEPGS
ncbi:MAG: dipeptide epimerase [Polyangiaceae bacterium]|nr:dipeptide epimerase [Polyangiaceae bacterium]